MLVIINR